MLEGWKTYKLGDLIDVKHGYAFKGAYFSKTPTNHILLSPGNFHIGGGFKAEKFKYYNGDYPKDYILKKGDLIITMTDLSPKGDTLGFPALIPHAEGSNYLHNQRLGLVKIITCELHSDYLYWALRVSDYQNFIVASATGSTVKHTSPSRIKEYEITIPPLQEQRAIASILSALDEKIELNLQMNKTLEDMAMALYKHWFVDFGPFQNGEFVDSELGMIPKGWEVKRLGDFVEHQKGFAFKSKWYQEHGKLIVRVSDTTANSIDLNTCNRIAEDLAIKYESYGLNTNDVIIATVGSWPPNYASVVGKVVRVPEIAKGALLNQNAVRLKMDINGSIQQGLLYYTLKTDRFLNYIVNSAQGSASQASIKLTDIFNYPIPFSEKADFDDFINQVESYLDQQNLLISENQTLTTLRDTLLPKLISGEVRVKDIEKTIAQML